jgi:hypothetical protein
MYGAYPMQMIRVEGDRLTIPKMGQGFPYLCAKCGVAHGPQSPLQPRIQNYRWVPPWTSLLIFVGLLPALIVQAIMTKTATVQLFICAPCNSRWKQAKLVWALSLLVPLVVFVALVYVGIATNNGGLVLGGILALLLLLVIVPAIIHFVLVVPRIVRTDFIDDYVITLRGVSPAVLAAFQQPPQPMMGAPQQYGAYYPGAPPQY